MTSIKAWLDASTGRLAQVASELGSLTNEECGREAEWLLCSALDQSRTYLFTWPERQLDSEELASAEAMLNRRLVGEPLAYIIGKQAFWTLELCVDPSTLIPRADTETLVEAVLERCPNDARRVVDLGSGTGAIALALAAERPNWDVSGVELQPQAVALARKNASLNKLSKVTFIEGSWFSPLQGAFDIIVSNPPYICSSDPHLEQGDVRFEPKSALISEKKGLDDIALIVRQAPRFMGDGGLIALEHGYDQGRAVKQLLLRAGFSNVETLKDLNHHDRVTLGKKL